MNRILKFAIFIACYAVFHTFIVRPYIAGCVCTSTARMDGKTVIITGANTGIGKMTALDLARRGARVILACRNLKKAEAAMKEIVEKTGIKSVVVKHLDLASLKSVRAFAADVNKSEPRLDVLINNAAVGAITKDGLTKTEDDFEMIMGVNHFGHFLLTNLLLNLLKKSTPSRIVVVSSRAHVDWLSTHSGHKPGMNFNNLNSQIAYNGFITYGQSKLANILFTRELARRLKGTGVTVNSLHPGAIPTNLDLYLSSLTYYAIRLIKLFGKTVEEGAQTTIHLAVSEKVEGVSGLYFADCEETEPSKSAQDDEAAKKLWEVSKTLVNLNTTGM